MRLLWRFRQEIGIAVLLGLVWLWHHGQVKDARDDGRAEIQAKWDDDTAARGAAAREAQRQADANKADAVTTGQEVDDALQEKLAAAESERDRYFGMLQRALGEVRACSSDRFTDQIVAAQASAAERARAIDEAVAGTIVESRMNADRHDALVTFLRAQKVCPVVEVP